MKALSCDVVGEVVKEKKSKPDTRNKGISTHTLIELRLKGLTYEEIAKVVGCHLSNVQVRLRRVDFELNGLKTFKASKGDILALYQRKLLSSISDADIKEAPLGSRVLAACQLYDKERLERGQSTSNVLAITAMIDVIEASEISPPAPTEIESIESQESQESQESTPTEVTFKADKSL